MQQTYAVAGIEPPLEELLNDRIAQLIMQRDGVEPADVWRCMDAARRRVAERVRRAAQQQHGLSHIINPLLR